MQLTPKMIAIDRLIPYAGNSKKHPDEQISKLASMLIEYGFDQPIVVDKDMVIIKGHGRRLAAIKAGIKEVPVIVRDDLSIAKARASRIADNKIAETDWDLEPLIADLHVLKTEDESMLSQLGFDDDELAKLMQESEETEGLTDPDAVPGNVNTRCKPGDLWQLGNHRLLCGDSTNVQHVERLMGGENAELCFTSPPYSDQREYNGGKELSTEFLATFIRASCNKVNIFAINLGISRKENEINQYWDDYIKEAINSGLKFLSWNIWDRKYPCSIAQQTAMFPIEHEWILIFGEKKKLNKTIENKLGGESIDSSTNRMADGTMKKAGMRTVGTHRSLGTIQRIDIHRGKSQHPAMFPVALPEEYINACTNQCEGVYEPFTGSGSTLIACEKTNRKCYGMELDPKYCDVILKRWEDFTGKKAELLND